MAPGQLIARGRLGLGYTAHRGVQFKDGSGREQHGGDGRGATDTGATDTGATDTTATDTKTNSSTAEPGASGYGDGAGAADSPTASGTTVQQQLATGDAGTFHSFQEAFSCRLLALDFVLGVLRCGGVGECLI